MKFLDLEQLVPLLAITMLLCLIGPGTLSAQSGEGFDGAEISKVINNVLTYKNIRKDKPNINPADKGEKIGPYDAVRTKKESGAELTFSDGSLARIGGDAFFSFSQDERDVQMGKGTALFQVPKGSEETDIQTATATASLTGTTLMVDQQPNQYVKTVIVEGQVDLSMPGRVGESRTLGPGEMVVMGADSQRIPEPVNVDLETLVETSDLVNEFDEDEEEDGEDAESGEQTQTDQTTQTNETQSDQESELNLDQMSEGIKQQNESKESGELEMTNMVIEGEGTEVTLTQDEVDEAANQTTTESDNKDAVESKSEFRPSLTLTSQSLVDFGSGSNPTAEDVTGEITTPSASLTEASQILESSNSEEAFLSLLSGGNNVALFSLDGLTIDGNPDVSPTSEVKNLAFRTQSAVNFNVDPLTPGGYQSLSLIIENESTQTLPAIQSSGVDVGVFATGDLTINDIDASNQRIVAGSLSNVSAVGRTLQGNRIGLFTDAGALQVDNSTVNAGSELELSGKSSSSSITIQNSSQLRQLSTAGIVDINSGGGNITLKNSRGGYYNGTSFSDNGGVVEIDSDNPDQSATVQLKGDGNFGASQQELMAQIIKNRAHGPEGQLLINGSFLQAQNTLKLYAPGSNGTIRFTGQSALEVTGSTQTFIMASDTIRVDNGVEVKLKGSADFFVNTAKYGAQGSPAPSTCNDSQCGKFVSSFGGNKALVTENDFGNQPGFE